MFFYWKYYRKIHGKLCSIIFGPTRPIQTPHHKLQITCKALCVNNAHLGAIRVEIPTVGGQNPPKHAEHEEGREVDQKQRHKDPSPPDCQ